VAWDEAQAEPGRANLLFDRLHDLSKQMRQSAEGRTAITGDPSATRITGMISTYAEELAPRNLRLPA